MKKILCLMIVVVLPLLAGTMTKTATFTQGDLVFSEVNGYDVVELRDYPVLINPGEPRLPRVVHGLIIPAGATPVGVELIAVNWIDLPGTYNIVPAQPDIPLPVPGQTFTPKEYAASPEIYGSSEPYPKNIIEINGVGNMNGYRIAQVEMFPVRYIPDRGVLQMATSITYRLEYQEYQVPDIIPTVRQKEVFGEAVRSIVSNPEDIAFCAPRVGKKSTVTAVPPGYYEYVIITEPPMDTVFQRLADWKTHKGVPATIVDVSWISSNYTGNDLAEKVRNFIIDAQANWGTIYFLLGGSGDYKTSGHDIVPTRITWYTSAGGGYIDSLPTDLYYADLDGNWNFDGDNTYGELGDSVDMYADVYVGRASVYNVALAQNFVHKVLTYEQNPPTDYIERLMLPTAILWSSYEERPMQDSIARMAPPGWRISKMYERNGTLSRQGMIDTMDVGYNLGHWEGHGDQNGIYMSGGPYLNSSDADGLVNGDKVGIANAIACHCGGWDMTPGGDCFAEHLVNRVGGGLCAAIMNGRYGWGAYVGGYVPGPSERIDTTFHAKIFTEGVLHLGQAHHEAKDAWVFYADSGAQYDMTRWCIYELNLFGCPEMPVWTDVPHTLTVNFPGAIPVGNQNVNVTVTSSGSPVNNALVCLCKGTETYASGRTNASGLVTLNVAPVTPGFMDITVTARNHYAFEDSIVVQASSYPYVTFMKCMVSDPAPGGNNNGQLNPGESVQIPLWVKNWGQTQANGVVGTIGTTDSYATLSDTIKSFGDIPADDSAYTGADGYDLDISGSCPNGHAILFTLTCKDNVDSTWSSQFNLTVYAPVLTYQDVSVVGGNNNGILDPGETADLVVTLMNEGGQDAENIATVLRESSPYITIDDSTGNFGDIPVDSMRDNAADPYTITASPTTPIGTAIDFTIHVTGANNYTTDVGFTLVVGAPGVDYVTHDCGNVMFTVTRYGALGYMASSGNVGQGFRYPISSATHLYYGSFCAGTDASYVVDRHYERNQVDDADWVTTASPDGMIRMYEPGPHNRDEYTTARYDDTGHPVPRGLVCDQFTWAWDDPTANDFVIMKFDMHNEGAATITDLYASIIIDFDIGSMTNNQGSSEAARNLTWMYVSTPYVGVEILDPPRTVPAVNLSLIDHATYVYPYSGLPDSVQILFMDGTIQNPSSNRPYDWSTCNSAGPFTIAPGEAAVAAFAILGGDNLTDFQANADTAYNRYWNWPGIKERTSGIRWTGVRLYPVISYHRPYVLEYAFSRETPLNVKVYDAVGRLVEHKDYGIVNGMGEFSLSLQTYAQGVYFVRVEADEHTTTKKIIWLK